MWLRRIGQLLYWPPSDPSSFMETRASIAQKWAGRVLLAAAASGVLAMLLRDRSRRLQGIPRRSPRDILVQVMVSLRINNLARLFSRSKVASYGLLLLLSVAGAMYGRSLWSGIRSLVLGRQLAPSDALDDYPRDDSDDDEAEEEDGDTEAELSPGGLVDVGHSQLMRELRDTKGESRAITGSPDALGPSDGDGSPLAGSIADQATDDDDDTAAEEATVDARPAATRPGTLHLSKHATRSRSRRWEAQPGRVGVHHRSGGRSSSGGTAGRPLRARHGRVASVARGLAEADAVARERRRADRQEAVAVARAAADRQERRDTESAEAVTPAGSEGGAAPAASDGAKPAMLPRSRSQDAKPARAGSAIAPLPGSAVAAPRAARISAGRRRDASRPAGWGPVPRSAGVSTPAVALPEAAGSISALADLGPSGVAFLRELQATAAGLDVDVLLSLHDKLETITLDPGEVLFRRGGAADEGMYVVVRGALEVVDEAAAGAAEALARRGRGSAQPPVGAVPLPAAVTGSRAGTDERTARAAVAFAWQLPGGSGRSSVAAAIAAPGIEEHRRMVLRDALPHVVSSSADGRGGLRLGLAGRSSGDRGVVGASLLSGAPSAHGDGRPSVADVWLRRRRLADAARREGVLATFHRAQTVGENALLAGPGETRAATVRATPALGRTGQPMQTTVLRMSRETFAWVMNAFPHSAASFVLSTTARQWRVAHLALVDFLRVPEAVALDREPRIRPSRERAAADVTDWLRRADGAAWALMLCAGQGLDDAGLASRAKPIYDRLQAGVAWEVAAGLTLPGSRSHGGEDQWRAGADDTAWDGHGGLFPDEDGDAEDDSSEEDDAAEDDGAETAATAGVEGGEGGEQSADGGGGIRRPTSFEERRQHHELGGRNSRGSPKLTGAALGGSATWLSSVLGTAGLGGQATAPGQPGLQAAASSAGGSGEPQPLSRSAARRRWRQECSASLEAIAFRLQGSQRAGLPGRGASFVHVPQAPAPAAAAAGIAVASGMGKWDRSRAILPPLTEADSVSESSSPSPDGSASLAGSAKANQDGDSLQGKGAESPGRDTEDLEDEYETGQRGFRERVKIIEAAAAGIVTLRPGDVLYREGADGSSPSDEPAADALLRSQTGRMASQTCFRAGACYVLLSGRAAAVTALPAADMDISLRSPPPTPVLASQGVRHGRTGGRAARAGARGSAAATRGSKGAAAGSLRAATGRGRQTSSLLSPLPAASRAQTHRRWSSGDFSRVLPSCGQATPGELLPSTHRIVRQLLPGDIAGGIACVCEVPHRETVVALAACTVAVFPRALLEEAAKAPAPGPDTDIEASPASREHSRQGMRGGAMSDDSRGVIVSLLLRCAKLLRPLLHLFLGMGLKRSWRHAGEVLFREGEPCDKGMFLVVSGRVRVFREQQAGMEAGTDGDDVSAGSFGKLGQATMEVSRGATVGELAVLAGRAKRSSSALCVRDTELVAISRASLSRILATHPGVMVRFSRALAERQLAMQRRLAGGDGVLVSGGMPFHLHSSLKSPDGDGAGMARGSSGGALDAAGMDGTGRGCVAVLPAGMGGRPLRQVGAWLSAELTCLCGVPARCICAEDVDAALGDGTTGRMTRVLERARVAAWLSRQEEVHSYIVLVGDTQATSWSKLAAQQADVILLVGRGEEAEEAAAAAAQLNEVEAHAVFSVRGTGSSSSSSTAAATATTPAAAARAEAPSRPLMRAQQSVAERLGRAGEAVGQALEALAGAAENLSRAAERALRGGQTAADDAGAGLENDAARAGVVVSAEPVPEGARAARMRTLARVELVLLWPEGTVLPTQTRKWLRPRLLAAHHHVREDDAPWLRGSHGDSGASSRGRAASTLSRPGTAASLTSDSASGASVTTGRAGPLGRPRAVAEADDSGGGGEDLASLASGGGGAGGGTGFGSRGTAAGDNGMARVARFLTGQAVGVVMGGGGARGLAHLGVLRALRERGVPVDFIAGTSQGAFMAATWATSLDIELATRAAGTLSGAVGSVWVLMSGLTLPLVSYFDGTAFSEAIQDALGPATQVEDMWLQFYCVSTNVTAARMDIHQTGPLWRCCRASMTVLGLLPPILDHSRKHLLADGGYLDNLPVGVMSALAPPAGFRAIIAIDVENKESGRPLENVEDYGEGLSGWWLLGRWALATLGVGPPVRIPAMSHVSLNLSYISHSIRIRHLLASASRLAGRHGPVGNGESASVVALSEGTGALGACGALLYVRPDVGHYGLLDYDKMGEIAARGRLETDAVLSEWLAAVNQPVCRFVSSMPRPEPGGEGSSRLHLPSTPSAGWAPSPPAATYPTFDVGAASPARSTSPAHLDLAEPATSRGAGVATAVSASGGLQTGASPPLQSSGTRSGNWHVDTSSAALSSVGLRLSEGPDSHVWQAAREASAGSADQHGAPTQPQHAQSWHHA